MPAPPPLEPGLPLLAYGLWIAGASTGAILALIAVATRLRWRDAARRRDLAAPR